MKRAVRPPQNRLITRAAAVGLGCVAAAIIGVASGDWEGQPEAPEPPPIVALLPPAARPITPTPPAPERRTEVDDQPILDLLAAQTATAAEQEERAAERAETSTADSPELSAQAVVLSDAAALATLAAPVETAIASAAKPAAAAIAPPKPSAPQATIGGHVFTPSGNPVTGAIVRLAVLGRTWNEARTDAEGGYKLEKVKPGHYAISARSAGFVDGQGGTTIDVGDGDVRSGIDIVLGAAGRIDGLLADADGVPIFGSRVQLAEPGVFGPVETRTDVDGRFLLVGAFVGDNTVTVIDDRYLPEPPTTICIPALEDGTPGLVAGVRITLSSGAALTGRLLGEDGNALPGFVDLRDASGRPLRSATVGVDGYRFSGLTPGHYLLDGGAPDGHLVARDAVDIDASDVSSRDLYLVAPSSVSGVVLDNGFPVQGVRVRAIAEGLGFFRDDVTAEDGTFRVRGLVGSTYRIVLFPPPRYATPDPLTGVVVPAGGDCGTDLVFQLGLGTVLSGTIMGSDGFPAAGATVAVFDARGHLAAAAGADPTGAFRIGQIPPGTVDVYARLGSDLARFETRVVAADDHKVAIALTPGAHVQGAVLYSDGTPCAGAQIDARSIEGTVHRSATTAPDGTFDIGDLYWGGYAITATLDASGDGTLLEVPQSALITGVQFVIR